MKIRPATCRRQSGFTLIELITVIAIIAILMALLFPAISGAKLSAAKAKASTVVRSVVNSCKNYANDYGKFPPVPGAASGASTGASSNSYLSFGDIPKAKCKVNNDQLFDVLRAISRGPNAEHALNRRQQKYFEETKATDPKTPREGFADGKEFPDTTQGQLLDPWGAQYCIVLDTDGDDVVKMSDFYSDLTDDIRFSALAFSLGKDGDLGGKGYQGQFRKAKSTEAPDDLASWQ